MAKTDIHYNALPIKEMEQMKINKYQTMIVY